VVAPRSRKPSNAALKERIRRYAETHFAGRYTRLDIRFRRQFCYVDAYTEPEPPGPDWPPPDWPESREEYLLDFRACFSLGLTRLKICR
jgi:hypothetical protein